MAALQNIYQSLQGTKNNSPMWSSYNPEHITKLPLYDFLSKNPSVFQRPGSSFDQSTGWQNTLSGGVGDIRASLGGDASPEYKKQFAEKIVGTDPNKYFNDNNMSGNYRYDPATGMVDTYYDPANQGDDFLQVLGAFGGLALGAGALNGAFGGAASGGAGGAFDMGGMAGMESQFGIGGAGMADASWGVNPASSMVENAAGAYDFQIPSGGGGFDLSTLGSPTNLQSMITGMDSTRAGASALNSMIGGAGDVAGKIASIPGGSSVLSKIINGTATTEDYISAAGKAVATALGLFGSSQQSGQLGDLASKYENYGGPSRARYEAAMTPGFNPMSIPGYAGALDTANKSQLAQLSVGSGNPFGNPGGLIDAQKRVVAGTALPAIQQYTGQNASVGFGAPMGAALNLQTQGIGADANLLNTLGYGLNALTSQPMDYAALLRQFGFKQNDGL